MPLLSSLPSTSLGSFWFFVHSSTPLPSNRTTAPSGGLAPAVGLLRTTCLPSAVLPPLLTLIVPSAISPSQSSPLRAVLPPSVLPLPVSLVLPSQPSPGRPPFSRTTS